MFKVTLVAKPESEPRCQQPQTPHALLTSWILAKMEKMNIRVTAVQLPLPSKSVL